MEAKEKAQELIDKMYLYAPLKEIEFYSNSYMAKQCALIVVDEIIAALEDYGQDTMELQNMDRTIAWYDKVKEEIQNM